MHDRVYTVEDCLHEKVGGKFEIRVGRLSPEYPARKTVEIIEDIFAKAGATVLLGRPTECVGCDVYTVFTTVEYETILKIQRLHHVHLKKVA